MIITRKELAHDICAYLGFIVFYLIAYRDMLFEQSLFWALNLSPLPTSNSRFYIPGQFYWFPGNLGSPAQPNIAGWLPHIFVQISGGNLVLAEKLLASSTLISCFAMYFFLSNHFAGSRLARFSAALIYGFGPATVLNFADILHWGYAAIPIVFNYILNLIEEKRKIKDVLLLGLSLSFMTAFLPQILSLIFLSILIFIAVRMLLITNRLPYLRRVTISFSLAILVFVAASPYLISGTYHFLTSIGVVSTSAITSPSLPTAIYPVTYSNQEIATTLRLIGGSPGNHLHTENWIGFVLPALAFGSLLLVHRGKRMLNLLALSLISLVTITVIYGIHLQTGWAMWLLHNTPVRLFFYPERPLYIVTFAYSVMISVTIEGLMNAINSFRVRYHLKPTQSISWRNLRHVFSTLLVVSLLASVFLFAPVFSVQIHQERYHSLPPVYSSVQNWLASESEGEMYRIMFLPTDSFSAILGYREVFEVAPGYALPHTQDYVNFVYGELIADRTQDLGSLLAPASVKYIVLVTVNQSSQWWRPVVVSPLYWWVSNPPRFLGEGGVGGDPVKIEALLEKQRDLKLIHSSDDFRVYENEMYMSKISVFANAMYTVGSESALSIMPQMQSFNVKDVLPIFAVQNPNLAQELPRVSSQIMFFNSDLNDYLGLLYAQKYGTSLIPFGTYQGWVQYRDNASLSTYAGGYIQTNVAQSLNASFAVEASGTYDLWLEMLFSGDGGELSIHVDNEMEAMIATNKSSVPLGFHWVPFGSVFLSAGKHFITILSISGSNAVGELAVIPSSDRQNIYEEAVNVIGSKKQVYLFDQDSSTLTRFVTQPQGQYWIAVSVPEPLVVDPSMGNIDLDSAQKFVIARENFKPARNFPKWDFDNANYYFVTTAGGWMSITFKGSGQVWAYVAHNSTLSNIGPQTPFYFIGPVENRTFDIYLPPNTSFHPIVNAYQPTIVGQNVSNNISEIIIEHKIGGEHSVLNFDGVKITSIQTPDVNAWSLFGPVYLDSGTHNLTITNGIRGSLVATYNTADLADLFIANTSIDYEFFKLSETNYNVDINTASPAFLSLSESFHPNWFAYSGGKQLMHFTASSFSDGFYLNRTDTGAVRVDVVYEPPLLNQVYVAQQILFVAAGLFLIASPIARRIYKGALIEMKSKG